MKRGLVILCLLPLGGCWETLCKLSGSGGDFPACVTESDPAGETVPPPSCVYQSSISNTGSSVGTTVAWSGANLLTSTTSAMYFSYDTVTKSSTVSAIKGDGYTLATDETGLPYTINTETYPEINQFSGGTSVQCYNQMSSSFGAFDRCGRR